jgi:transcriptional regulator with XRE-family HTH domain
MARLQAGQRDALFKKTFGHVLRQMRLDRGLSQEALADASGCHVNHVSFLERGLRSPNLLVVFDLAAALKVSPSDFIARVETALHLAEAAAPPPPPGTQQ